MIKALLFDFSRTLLFPKDKEYLGSLNELYNQKKENLDFNFFAYFELNTELIDYLKSVKEKFKLYIFTSESIQNDPAVLNNLHEAFDKIYSAKEIGYSKKDVKSYEYIVSDIGVHPDEALFIDDSDDNVATASKAGVKTVKYTNNIATIEAINAENL